VHRGHPIEEVLSILSDIRLSLMPSVHNLYEQYVSTLKGIEGHSQCEKALNTGWTRKIRSENRNSTEGKRTVYRAIDSLETREVCTGVDAVISFQAEFVPHPSRRNAFDSVARVYKVGGALPCPRTILLHKPWFFPQDRKEWYRGGSRWKNHVYQITVMARYRDLGLDKLPVQWVYEVHPMEELPDLSE